VIEDAQHQVACETVDRGDGGRREGVDKSRSGKGEGVKGEGTTVAGCTVRSRLWGDRGEDHYHTYPAPTPRLIILPPWRADWPDSGPR
jgi:hypothetical protein